MLSGRGPSKLWPRLLGRAYSWSPVVEKLTGEFGIAASHKLRRNPGPNPSELYMTRPSDMGSMLKVSMPKQGQYVLLCCSPVLIHRLQVGCLFVFGLASCTVRTKASIEQLLSCLPILLLEAKSKAQQLQTRALKSPKPCVLWPWVQNWLAASQPTTGNMSQHDVHVCHMEICMWLMSERSHQGCWCIFGRLYQS